MLKTTKIIAVGLGFSLAGAGGYYLIDRYYLSPRKPVQPPVVKTKKVYDTVPAKDSSLDKLKRILADNEEARNGMQNLRMPVEVETYEHIDKNSRLYDSLVSAGSIKDVNGETEDITIGKVSQVTSIKAEKFLSKKQFTVIGAAQTSKTDSLASSLAGIKTNAAGSMMVEFWESPVNYKGYRLGKDKMILFGIIPDGVNLVKYSSDLYLTTLNNVYLVKPCTDFCQLKPIKDKTICANVMRYVN